MKQASLFLAALLLAFGTPDRADAKKTKDQEFRHVTVTLRSGEQVDGYLHRGWHAESSLLKKENYSFKLVRTPDDKEPVKYTADEVESVEYVEKTESNPDGIRWESRDLASPGLGNRYRMIRRMICLNKAGENATTYWWKIWTTEQVGSTMRRVLQTIYGIRFHDDPDGIVYPYMFLNTVLMDKQHPGLKTFCKKWFKGSEGRAHKKAANTDDAWVLDMYDAYLAQQKKDK